MKKYQQPSIYHLERFFTTQTVFNSLEFMLNIFLDQSTKEIISKSYQLAHENNLGQPKLATQFHVIGIKLFLIYKKILKKGHDAKKLMFDMNCNMYASLQKNIVNTSDNFKKYIIIEKGIIMFNVIYLRSEKQVLQLIQKLSNTFEQVKYNQKSKKISLLSKKIKGNFDNLVNLLYHALAQILKFKYSRQLYNNVISKYKTIKNQYVKIKEQSQIFSQRFLSETSKDNNHEQCLNDFAKQNKKFPRSKRSQDNLYNLRKISIAQELNEINEEPIEKSTNQINQISSNQQISEIIKQIDESSKNQNDGDDNKKNCDPNIKILNDSGQL